MPGASEILYLLVGAGVFLLFVVVSIRAIDSEGDAPSRTPTQRDIRDE
jgi:hypothetical protein